MQGLHAIATIYNAARTSEMLARHVADYQLQYDLCRYDYAVITWYRGEHSRFCLEGFSRSVRSPHAELKH